MRRKSGKAIVDLDKEPRSSIQRRVRLRELSREGRARTSSARQERRDLERRDLAGRPRTNLLRSDVSFSSMKTPLYLDSCRTEWTEWFLNARGLAVFPHPLHWTLALMTENSRIGYSA